MARIVQAICGVLVLSMSVAVSADAWYGTAPFCSGSCPSGWQQVKRTNCCGNSDPGCGACCWTGTKALCHQPGTEGGLSCVPRQTNTVCYGIILICNDGYYEISGAYRTCNSYACGVCFGFGKWG